MSAAPGFALAGGDLHASLENPVLGSVAFLNEVMTRYPSAISFAPGAPYLAHLADVDVTAYAARYERHLVEDRGTTVERARNLLHEYGPSRGLINDLIAAALRHDQGIDVPPRSVVVTVGAQEAMLLTLRALCRSRDDLLAVVEPAYVGMTGAARLLDVDLAPVPETADGVDLDALRGACAAARTRGRRIRALYVAPDYSNPSGSVLDLETRRRLLAVADQEDLVLIEDSAYGFTAPPGRALPSLKALDTDCRVVHLGTFAKVCLPGARVGFAVADQPVVRADGTGGVLADDLAVLKGMVTVNTSPLCQAVIGGMLLAHGGSLSALGDATSAHYRRNLAHLLAALDRELGGATPPGVRWNSPSGGFFVRVRLPVRVDTALLEWCATEFGVLWTPMEHFYLSGGGTDELRLSCSYLTPDRIDEGIGRFADFVREVAGPPRRGRRALP
ncbi:PLP-dependent aminotransferase family protein [Streptomyces sp. YGL11-2]|uniref:aminotransferase-like domain-containing protein n=1 Tax=Streptomyces sp. YGL11-2 TaxID=3414028 RepID=UPI003CF2187B